MSWGLEGRGGYDLLKGKGMDRKGLMNMGGVGVKYLFKGWKVKVEGMYEFVGGWGEDREVEGENEELGIGRDNGRVMVE